ncbi:MAG: hypothetical protein EXR75_02665 [Myxococcales bacterium]|nr:hypothetical protein [Myxococcales bacterium]
MVVVRDMKPFERIGYFFVSAVLVLACGDGDVPRTNTSGGSTASSTGAGGGAGGTGAPGLDAYAYRRAIGVTGTVLPGHSFTVALDHAKLVADGKASKVGSDVRIAYVDGEERIELDRVLDPRSSWDTNATRLWFRTPDNASAGGEYFLFYGNDAPQAALDDPRNVYLLWDAFDEAVTPETWTLTPFGSAEGSFTVKDGVLRISGKSGDFGSTSDGGVLFHRSVSGDLVAEVEIAKSGGSLGGDAKLGGLMLRASDDPSAAFGMLTIRELPRERWSIARTTAGGTATATSLPVPSTFPQLVQLRRQAAEVSCAYSDDGVNWVALGSPQSLSGLVDPVLLGVPFANISGDVGYTEISWFRAYRRVSPAPVTSVGDEVEN